MDYGTIGELADVAGYEKSVDVSSAMQPDAANTGRVESEQSTEQKDYFVKKDGVTFAGTHLLIDLDGASNLNDLDVVEHALRESALVSGATILNVDLHHFEPNGGISGVVVLSESHISIHTWPEKGFAALDIFMCGECDPYKAIPVLKRAFLPEYVQLAEQRRGLRV